MFDLHQVRHPGVLFEYLCTGTSRALMRLLGRSSLNVNLVLRFHVTSSAFFTLQLVYVTDSAAVNPGIG